MKPQRKRKRKREVREAKQRKRARERGNNDQIPSHPYQTAGRTHTRHHSRRTMHLHSPQPTRHRDTSASTHSHTHLQPIAMGDRLRTWHCSHSSATGTPKSIFNVLCLWIRPVCVHTSIQPSWPAKYGDIPSNASPGLPRSSL